MLPGRAVSLLGRAFTDLLGEPATGSVAYTRCLPPEPLRALAANRAFSIEGWNVAAVVEETDPTRRMITADQAVEWRENKQEAALLLVDPTVAGAGMDGIYSAAREIGEEELFTKAQDLARAELPHGYKGFAKKALAKARTATRQRTSSPWRAFLYLCQGAEDPRALGKALPEIGLWPVDIGEEPADEDLDRSARLTERLLPAPGMRVSPEERVAALKLGPGAEQTERDLVGFLREVEHLPRLEALAGAESRENFWLNHLRPGLFDEQTLQGIEWISWRGKSGKPLSWSGLSLSEDNRLEWVLNRNVENPKERARLEVRWRVAPDSLARGAVDYVVEIHAGQDVLASQNVSHSGKSPQKAVFTQDDLEDLEENARFEAQVVISALGDPPYTAETEDFVLCFGSAGKGDTEKSAGKIHPTLALAVIHVAPDWESFKSLAREPKKAEFFSRDKKGYISCRCQGKVGRVFCPPLLARLADDWIAGNGALGRWRLRVRADGTPVEEAKFVPVASNGGAERLTQASRQFANWLAGTQGPLGILYQYEDASAINSYVLAALSVWGAGAPELTLIQTLEVMSVAGHRLGLIVLPTHPLRVAWQQSYDLLAAYHRYHKANEDKLSPRRIEQILSRITGAHCPAFLPGLEPGESFVFADTLGLHAAALVPANDPEPKATVALLARLMGDDETAAPTVGRGTATALAEEVRRYMQLHPAYRRIQVHGLRAGDAMAVARALGGALSETEEDDGTQSGDREDEVCYDLDLYPAAGQATELTGRFLSTAAERRRSGAGAIREEDRRLLESVTRPGGVTLPRLRWARRSSPSPSTPAHLAIAFDVFSSRVECRALDSLPGAGVLEAHGLAAMPTRQFHPGPTPHWLSFVPPNPEGEKHPLARMLTERQVNLHAAILQATCRHLGGGPKDWPALVTDVSADQADSLQVLHGLCDWVITADRHAGMEYFDSPRDLPQVYDAYIIDCVPERDDLGFLQLITSTSSFDEVVGLLDVALGEMGLSASPRNCRFLLDALKAVSGRLALRLAGAGNTAQEMIALALVHSHCARAVEGDEPWLALGDGYFVPLDDVPELFREPGKSAQGSEQRADLLYVSAPKRGGLRLTFVEVKFRRYLKTARAPELAEAMGGQLEASCRRWEQMFGANIATLEKTVNRTWLARILRFYARKGRRHTLSEDAFERATREIDRIVRRDVEPPPLDELGRLGYVFCPEYGANRPARIAYGGEAQLWLFGPDILPEPRRESGSAEAGDLGAVEAVVEIAPGEPDAEGIEYDSASPEGGPVRTGPGSAAAVPGEGANSGAVEVLFGYRLPDDEPVTWRVSIRANPHLMILGLPGMGKTTCLINLCQQLDAQGVTPIVFSYHQDIDDKLSVHLPEPPLVVRYAGLGFNPLQVDGDSAHAHVDNVGMLRDIFAAIFPELGDIQLGRLREALKQSYVDQGWGPGQQGEVPAFHAFLDLLRADPKPDKGLLMRLNELEDYGLFNAGTGAPTLLSTARPALIEIHGTQNEHLQRAFATFVLYNLYQNMFRRGPQSRITHAVIFDEAHRAAKLKLIPTMVKECRKYGIAFVVASQEARDFDPSLFNGVANYLALRLIDADAKLMAKIFATADRVRLYTDRIKQMPKYRGMYYGEGLRAPISVALAPEVPLSS